MKYREKTESCAGCENNDSLEHKLFHKSGLSSGIITELKLTSVEEIKNEFRCSYYLSPCFINLKGRKTKVIDGDMYLMPENLIGLIGENKGDS
jgi:hypothetical protein